MGKPMVRKHSVYDALNHDGEVVYSCLVIRDHATGQWVALESDPYHEIGRYATKLEAERAARAEVSKYL